MWLILAILKATKRRMLMRLRESSLHGYELAREVDIPVTGIYQHLRELEAEGLITYKKVNRRKVFSLTEKGTRLIDVLEPRIKS
jgi:DNA-binding PadR family transcriptional regulator